MLAMRSAAARAGSSGPSSSSSSAFFIAASKRAYSTPIAPLLAPPVAPNAASSSSSSLPPTVQEAILRAAGPSSASPRKKPMMMGSYIPRPELSSPPSFRSNHSIVATPDDLWRSSSPRSFYPLPLTTTTARTIPVKNAAVAAAFRKLNRVLTENNIRRELKRGERFEGVSAKRCRLSSERHRRRYKVAVGKAVGKAMRMRE